MDFRYVRNGGMASNGVVTEFEIGCNDLDLHFKGADDYRKLRKRKVKVKMDGLCNE